MNYAGFWQRFLAGFIDGIILTVILSLVNWFVVPKEWMQSIIYILILMIVVILYYALFESSAKQATWGAMALGLKIVDYNNQRISFGRAIIRTLSKYISMMILMIGYLMIAFTSRKQGLHDMIAKTLVIKG